MEVRKSRKIILNLKDSRTKQVRAFMKNSIKRKLCISRGKGVREILNLKKN